MSDVKQFRLPDVGEGLTEADILSWHVKPGDRVKVNQVIVEIETAKAVVELPCPWDGTVTGLLVDEGQTADVGTPIIEVDVAAGAGGGTGPGKAGAGTGADAGTSAAEAGADGGVSAPGTALDSPPASPEEPERQSVLVGYGVKTGPAKRRPRKGKSEGGSGAGAGARQESPPGAEAADGNGRGAPPTVLAKPPVRKLAKDLGVDLADVTGSGPGGVITRDDVQAAAGAAAPGAVPAVRPAPAATGQTEERIPVRGVRKHTAAAVTASAFTAPHVTEFVQADVTATMAATERIAGLPEFAGLRVSPLLLVARALLLAVARHPQVNSSWDEPAQEIVVKHYVNLGIAAATSRGLIVPNVKDAHAMALPELARALGELTTTAREGKTAPAALAGGTITITNVGVFGVDGGTPILTPGEAAILAFGQVRDAPWVVEGQLAVRKVTTLSLSFDHRIVDGDLGSAVLRDVADMLTDPVRMLAWS
ncbi:MAG: 2-oxo acid dehydrogenase subunit E2 [Nocardiopsaceae bacterium]|jgi:pyruvate dehydrogenase E2 component (dihydrolipoamide acetyltransferase)|nr:2-oxo acid dehydrogenase subunit E2 [Nocardiopsaceae bacterium]